MSAAGWVAVVTGLYYAVKTSYILSKWVGDDYDVARPKSVRFHEEASSGEYGLLGFQAGLIRDQKIDELSWTTRIPFEFRMRRNVNTETRPPKDNIEMSLRIRWYDLSGINEVIKDSSIPLEGQANFTSVDYQDMYPLNDSHSGKILLASKPGETPQPQTTPENHPTFFDVIQPLDMKFGALEDLELSWKVKLYPAGTTTWNDLARWFNPDNPGSVQLGTIMPKARHVGYKSQEIAYDYW